MMFLPARRSIASGMTYSRVGCLSRSPSSLPSRCRVFSSTSSLHNADNNNTHHHRKPGQRQKLHIGFASLSNTLPFEAPSNTNNGKVGDKELDPRASIMLTALRGDVSSFDCPAPPLIEQNIQSSRMDGTMCWMANRQSEVNIGNAFDQAWEVLLEEDDGEALNVTAGEGSAATISSRLGYRAALVLSEKDANDAKDDTTITDCQEREGKFHGDNRVNLLFPGKAADEDDENSFAQPAVALVHNLSQEYVLHSLRTSPLIQKYKLAEPNGNKRVSLISLAHNPETQIAAYLMNNHHQESKSQLLQNARIYMKEALKSAFVGYEIAVSEGLIDGYGVDSNGLSLQPNHDMHLSWRDILECAADGFFQVHGSENSNGKTSSLTTIRLPGNVLETRGLMVAEEIRSFFGTADNNGEGNPSEEGLPTFTEDQSDPYVQQRQKLRKMRKILPKSVQVYVTRPLTAYPHGGTGWDQSSPGLSESGAPPTFLNGDKGSTVETDGKKIDAKHPVRILDYQVESGPIGQPGELSWTNLHYKEYGPRPSAYQPILNAVLSHFDAEAILEASLERELTVEERETLEGCKLIRDMVHDLDVSLDTMKSFAAYEEYLVNVAVPLIYGSFEELDEESAGMLQLFFRVHGMAVRMVVSRWTREMLMGGWTNNTDPTPTIELDKDQEEKMKKIRHILGFDDLKGGYNIPSDMTLQEFALRNLLDESAVRGVVVGCSRPEHVLEAVSAADTSNSV